MDERLKEELLKMASRDEAVHAALAASGELFDGYHPSMERVHLEHAERLAAIVAERGWPGVERVGTDGEAAAWLILQHAISDPPFQREGLRWLKEAAERGDAPWYQVALLEDRIRFNEGRAQLFGTQLDWDENGQLSPFPGIEDPSRLAERRRAVGLGPLEAEIASKREAAEQSRETPPSDLGEHRRKTEAWARKVGWRQLTSPSDGR